jgi:hypothetical protein
MKMAAQLGGMRSDTIHASMWSHNTLLAGKPGNTHVVPPKAELPQQPRSVCEPETTRSKLMRTYHARQPMSISIAGKKLSPVGITCWRQ